MCAQLGVELLCQLLHAIGLVHVHRQNSDLERRDGVRPDNAAIVKVLLNSGGHHAGHPNTVAAHGQDLVAAVFTLYRGIHRLRVLGA